MENHHTSEALACVDLGAVEIGLVNFFEESRWVVADVLSTAVIFAIANTDVSRGRQGLSRSCDLRSIEKAVAKGAQGNVSVVCIGPIGKFDVHDSNAINYRAGNGCDDQEYGSDEEKQGSHMVNEASLHVDELRSVVDCFEKYWRVCDLVEKLVNGRTNRGMRVMETGSLQRFIENKRSTSGWHRRETEQKTLV